MKKIIAILMFLLSLFAFISCDETQYFESAKWNVSVQEFEEKYIPVYEEKIFELTDKYDLDYEMLTEIDKNENTSLFKIYLYNEEFTIKIIMRNDIWIAAYDIALHYYGSEPNDLGDYESQSSIVNFINDFTDFVAFDTKSEENRLEMLYQEACNSSNARASDMYHFDNYVGNVGYSVVLNNTSAGYYYMMQKDSDLDIVCNSYGFEGLLKPIE